MLQYYGHTETVRYSCGFEGSGFGSLKCDFGTGLRCSGQCYMKYHPDVVEVLIDAGADVDATTAVLGVTPLRSACEGRGLEIVQMLVEAGADVHVVDNFSNTILMHAALYSDVETVRYLVGLNKVDVNHRNSFGNTALHNARKKQHTDVEQVLLKCGAEE